APCSKIATRIATARRWGIRDKGGRLQALNSDERGNGASMGDSPSQISVLDLPCTRGADLGRFRRQLVSVNQRIAKLAVVPYQYIQPARGVAGLGALALQCRHGLRVQLAIGDVALAPEPYRLGHES